MKKSTKNMLWWAALAGGAFLLFRKGKEDGKKELATKVVEAATTPAATEAAQSGYFTI